MMSKAISTIYLIFIATTILGQDTHQYHPHPRYRIYLNTTDKRLPKKGLLIKVEDSSIIMFPGSRKLWAKGTTESTTKIDFDQIGHIRLKRQNGLLKGLFIGCSAGLLPLLVGSFLKPGGREGAAYVTIATAPLGILLGGIIGASSKRNFEINGNYSTFSAFKKRVRKL